MFNNKYNQNIPLRCNCLTAAIIRLKGNNVVAMPSNTSEKVTGSGRFFQMREIPLSKSPLTKQYSSVHLSPSEGSTFRTLRKKVS